MHVYFRPLVITDETTSSLVELHYLWHMLSLLSPARAVANAVASAILMQVCAVRFSTFRYIPRFLWMKLPTVHADCFFFSSTQIISHLSKRKVTLYLMRCCNLFFLTSVMNMKFCRYEGTYPYFLII